MELSDSEQSDMLSIVASVLHLGNVKFIEEEGVAAVCDLDHVERIAEVSRLLLSFGCFGRSSSLVLKT